MLRIWINTHILDGIYAVLVNLVPIQVSRYMQLYIFICTGLLPFLPQPVYTMRRVMHAIYKYKVKLRIIRWFGVKQLHIPSYATWQEKNPQWYGKYLGAKLVEQPVHQQSGCRQCYGHLSCTMRSFNYLFHLIVAKYIRLNIYVPSKPFIK